jgi:NADPH-dependent glutamate synthase beta subunit-like oxidoreductase
MSAPYPPHVVAVVGGATAGAEAAAILAERGVIVAVFEQNVRPYGKIEDGLPRWHVKLRKKEYDTINEKLDRPNVHFVPSTRIGRDVEFPALAREWGFTAILLAHGAWRDRPLPVEGADAYVGRGLVYQNPFIYWFNHYPEAAYDGPRYEIHDGTIVVGGGLASIDVLKVIQLELVRRALAERGIDEDVIHLEHEGIPAALAAHGLTWEQLGLRGATLYYRRRIEDMPLAEIPDGADAARAAKFEATRRKILEKAMQKYCFSVRQQMLPVGLIVEDGRLVGLRFQQTRVEGGRAIPVANAFEDVRTPMVVSSIGSIPESMAGIAQDDVLYRYSDPRWGQIEGYDCVFATGNVITGKGNIAVSRRHSVEITSHVVESFLGLANGHAGEERLLEGTSAAAAENGRKIAEWVAGRPPLPTTDAQRVLARVQERQRAVGYDGNYRAWLARVTPPDLA